MVSSKLSKQSKLPRVFSYVALVGLAVLIGYLGFTAPKSDGKLLLANGEVFYPSQRCVETGEADLPKFLKGAFVAAQDKDWIKFHPFGIPISILWREPAGGLTISMMISRDFIGPFNGRPISDKVLRVLQLEWFVRKCVLLELYTAKTFFGRNRFGVHSAAKGFFSKEPANLSIAQVAFLGAITRGPSVYLQPTKFHRTIFYRNEIIERMSNRGLITKQQAELAKQEPIQFH